VISRGNSQKKIFRSADAYLTFTEIVGSQKSKLSFRLYAYCLRSRRCLAWPEDERVESQSVMQQQQAERIGSSEGGSDGAVEARRHTGPGTGSGAGSSPISSYKTDGGRSIEWRREC
jgi:hypothetical protein